MSKKIKPKPLSDEEREDLLKDLRGLTVQGIRTKIPDSYRECRTVYMDRPCPYVQCKYNNYLDVEGESIRFNFPDLEPWEMDPKKSCALDMIDAHDYSTGNGKLARREIGDALGVSREWVRLTEKRAILKLRDLLASSNKELFKDFLNQLNDLDKGGEIMKKRELRVSNSEQDDEVLFKVVDIKTIMVEEKPTAKEFTLHSLVVKKRRTSQLAVHLRNKYKCDAIVFLDPIDHQVRASDVEERWDQ